MYLSSFFEQALKPLRTTDSINIETIMEMDEYMIHIYFCRDKICKYNLHKVFLIKTD